MGKATNRQGGPVFDQSHCASCGWNFEQDNARRVPLDPAEPNGRTTTNPRSIINVHGKAYCDVCYCRALMQAGKHSAIGTPYAGLHRDALFPEHVPRKISPEQRSELAKAMENLAARFDMAKAIADTAPRFGEKPEDFEPDEATP